MTITRHPSGTAAGGRFAPTRRRPAAGVALFDPNPRLSLTTLAAERPEDMNVVDQLLPNLDRVTRSLRWDDIVKATELAQRFRRDPGASQDASPAERVVDIDDVALFEDGMGNPTYDYPAYGDALAGAWAQHAEDAIADAVAEDLAASAVRPNLSVML